MGKMRFILGRAGTGKTRLCVDLVARQLRKSPLTGPGVILLVPEQATFQMRRMLATWRHVHGFVRARVLGFKDLAYLTVDRDSGGSKPMLDFSRRLVMQQILTATHDQLKFWNNVRPERISHSILQLMDELTQAELGVEGLAKIRSDLHARGELTRQLGDKLSDMALLLGEYQKMDMAGLDDPLVYLDRFRKSIDKMDWFKGSYLCVDGFAGFTGQQYAALAAIMQAAAETHITLSLDPERLGKEPPPAELNIFWPSEQTYFRLLSLAKQAGVEVGKPIILDDAYRRRYRSSTILWNLERVLTGRKPGQAGAKRMPTCGEAVKLVSAEDPRHEVELAAGKILQLVREKGFRFRDVSVILRNLDSYEHLIRYLFDQYKIPFFLDLRRPIAHHPLTRMILSAVGALATGYETRWMLRYMKAGMTGIPEHAADRIESYVLAHGIDKDRWLNEWRYRTSVLGINEDDPTAPVEDFNLQTINKHRMELLRPLQSLSKLLGIREDTSQAFAVDILLDGLMRFLKELDAVGKLEDMIERERQELRSDSTLQGDEYRDQSSQIHRQIWDKLTELFHQLQITLAGRDLTLEHFLSVLTDSFAELDVGVIPSSADQVLVGTIDRTRHPDVRATFIMGFNEGVWPQPPEEDVVLTDVDRQKLAWDDLPQKANLDEHYLKEQYLTYIGFTRASDFLWVSFSRRTLTGVPSQPSRYFRRIEQYCGKLTVASRGKIGEEESFNGETPIPLTASNLVGETIIGLRTFGFGDDGKFWVALADALAKKPDTRPTFHQFALGLCDGNVAEISPKLSEEIFPTRVSFSQIESFYRCPFQHFARYGLRLQVAARYRLEPVDLGQFRHAVMAESWKKIIAEGEKWNQLPRERIGQIVGRAIEICAEETKSQVLFSNARNRYITERTRSELTLAVDEQLRMLRSGKFIPSHFEKFFEYPLQVAGRTWQLVGRVDRVDLAQYDDREWVMILDYKSRVTTFRLKDWQAGVQMQLPGYLFVSTVAGEKPAGAVFLPLVPQKPKSDGCFFPASGLICFQALGALADQTIGEYPYCIKIKKDGQPAESGPVTVLNEELLEGIMAKTRQLVIEALEAMTKGRIDIHPYHDGRVSVCPNCEFHGVCRFDHHLNHYRSTGRADREEILRQVVK